MAIDFKPGWETTVSADIVKVDPVPAVPKPLWDIKVNNQSIYEPLPETDPRIDLANRIIKILPDAFFRVADEAVKLNQPPANHMSHDPKADPKTNAPGDPTGVDSAG